MQLKAKFTVLHTEQEQATALLALLEGYGIKYRDGYRENVPHPKERWVIPEIDYAVNRAVWFRVPKDLRTDRAFVERLSKFVFLDESDFTDLEGVAFPDDEYDETA